jgi:hypothetical protein
MLFFLLVGTFLNDFSPPRRVAQMTRLAVGPAKPGLLATLAKMET